MLTSWTIRVLLVTFVALGAASCDDEPPTAPTPPAPVTETFSGSITPNGVSIHPFSAAGGGTLTATLKQVAPDGTLVVGFSVGNWNGSACQIVLDNNAATGGAVLSGSISGIGNFCIRMYDVGNIAATPATYTVEVVHP